MLAHPLQIFVQLYAFPREIEPQKGFVIEVTSSDFRCGGISGDGSSTVKPQNIVNRRAGALAARDSQRPSLRDASENRRQLFGHELVEGNCIRRDSKKLAHSAR